ncbi:ABC transporter substrate-binding protein [Virgibacillus halophilus]|uniref:Sugar ABC transporter substrate-binding protein n=1 Tax=Tigheibacillus halophilus TaxID=361280 RepID=A0ABU5C2X8_9BACI|nr:sugar ABC transporter substrate-binding protein [Virgibacillus halophilus]
MRKLSLLTAVFLLSILIISGCSKNAEGNNSGNDKVVLNVIDPFGTEPQDSQLTDILKQYEDSHPNVTIKRQSVPAENLISKVIQQASSGSAPDVIFSDAQMTPKLASSGAITPLDKYMDKFLGDDDLTSVYEKSITEIMKYNNKIYGVPVGNNTEVYFYNKDVFEKDGITPPKTWDELNNVVGKLKENNEYSFGYSAIASEFASWSFLPYAWMKGKDLKHFNTSETIEALNFWTDFVKDGYTPKSVLNWTENDVATQFINGKFPMFQGGSWIIPIMEKEDINYDIIPLPTPEKGGDSMGPIGGEVMVIGKNSKNEKAAWDFIAWTQDEEVLNPINETFGYLPAYLPAQEKYLKEHPKFESVAETLKHGKSRTAVVGIDYPEISKELWKGIQNVITGENTSDEIVKQIQDKVDNLSD